MREPPMLDHLEALQQVVQDAIDQERLGQPQFIRCIARAPSGQTMDESMEMFAALGESWFGAAPAKRTRRGDDDVYLTEMSTWDTGQSAIIMVSRTTSRSVDRPMRDGSPDIDLMLVGSRGTLYHQA